MKPCISHKKIYLTLPIAEEALIGAHTNFEYRHGTGPIAVYKCEDCGYYHLTSKGVMNERLKQYLEEGKVQRQKEADHWLSKLRKK